MDPAEWEELADRIAAQLQQAISQLEERLWPLPVERFGQAFWPQVRGLNERVRTAPAIKLDDKLALHRRLNELCHRARQHQKSLQQQAARERDELHESIALVRETLEGDLSIRELHELRAELVALRDRLRSNESTLRRMDRQHAWQAWQQTNQLAWHRLNELWKESELILTALLNEAQARLAAGDTRAAKDKIKAFHVAAGIHECSHATLRALRGSANSLWEQADARAREKHQAYLEHARRRLGSWRAARQRNSRRLVDLEEEIAQLERQAGMASTDVAAAMARGQIAERRRAMAEVEAVNRALEQRISSVTLALEEPPVLVRRGLQLELATGDTNGDGRSDVRS
jgi:hypothetical protein